MVSSMPAEGGDLRVIWTTASGGDLDANQGVVYWNESPYDRFPGCLGRANPDGTDGRCLDQGDHQYQGVRVDDAAVYFIRDGQILRLPK